MLLVKKLNSSPVEIARPGFINIYVKNDFFVDMLSNLYGKGPNYCGLQKKIFVKLYIMCLLILQVHCMLVIRVVALGSALANILCGHEDSSRVLCK
jgi:hypothetical protein